MIWNHEVVKIKSRDFYVILNHEMIIRSGIFPWTENLVELFLS